MRKALLATMLLLLPILLFSDVDELQDGIDALQESVDLSEWDDWFREIDGKDAVLPSELFAQFIKLETSYSREFETAQLVTYLIPSMKAVFAKEALLMGLAILGASLHGISNPFSIGETAEAAFRICASSAVLVLTLTEIRGAVTAISTLEHTSELLMPVIVGFSAFCGLENTALLIPATNALFSGFVVKLTEMCVVPLAVIGGVLLVLDAGGSGRLASIGRLLQRSAKWILVTVSSVYMLVTAARSIAAGGADSLLLKTAKFAAGSIPSIGSLLSESVDTALQCMQFVRNALGLTGCVVLLSAALKPVISIFLTRSCLRVSSMLSEPLAGKPYAEMLRGMGDTLQVLMLSELAVLATSVMMITPIFGAGGAS